jgi:menaquinol-cytochrome c reductase cytochrome b/c subunit
VAHNHNSDEKIVYVGDSRVPKKNQDTTPRDFSAYPGKSEAFVPNFLLKEWMVGAVVLVGFMSLIIAHPSPLGYPADPLNSNFIPMPDWYFLFLYQLLKYPYMSDQFVVLGTVVLPGLMFGALTIAPFLDTGKERRFYRRPVASALVLLSVAAIIHLTYVSWTHYQHELEARGITPEHIEREERMKAGEELPSPTAEEAEAIPIVNEDSEGFQIYQEASCIACHAAELEGNSGVPALLGVGDKYTKEEIMAIIKNGKGTMSAQYQANLGEPYNLTETQLDTLAGWLAEQKTQEDPQTAEQAE